jgi:hypothetical protein
MVKRQFYVSHDEFASNNKSMKKQLLYFNEFVLGFLRDQLKQLFFKNPAGHKARPQTRQRFKSR